MSTDLTSLREYVANVLDYDPTNPTYKKQLNKLLNEAERRIITEKLFTFAQVVKKIPVRADINVSGNVSVTSGSAQVQRLNAFADWMAGHLIEIEGVEYEIAWVESVSSIYLTQALTLATGTYPGKVIQRWVYLPQDCVQVVSIAQRSNSPSPSNPGQLTPLTQFEDEYANLPLGETSLPDYWVPGNPVGVTAPRVGGVLGTTSGLNQGVRTIEVAFVHRLGSPSEGYRSAIGSLQTVTLTPTQVLTVTPSSALDTTTGLWREVWLRAPTHGLEDWRPALQLGTSTHIQFSPLATAGVSVQSSLTHLQSEGYYLKDRLTSPSGVCDRIRLHPRQDSDMELSVRYMRDHRPMVEDNDTPIIPPPHRMAIAYRALYEVLFKHNNPSLAELYRKRYDAMLLQLEARYLSQPSRRLVRGMLSASMVPESPFRQRRLVRL
jgi:hypothetical protein